MGGVTGHSGKKTLTPASAPDANLPPYSLIAVLKHVSK